MFEEIRDLVDGKIADAEKRIKIDMLRLLAKQFAEEADELEKAKPARRPV